MNAEEDAMSIVKLNSKLQWCDAYILVKRTITVDNISAAGATANVN